MSKDAGIISGCFTNLVVAVSCAALVMTGCGANSGHEEADNESAKQEVADAQDAASTDDQDEVQEPTRKLPAWTGKMVVYEVNIRQYSEEGTFNAFRPHLQELKDMGINTLWFMPVHPISETNRSGSLGSYYSITDYREINPEFGSKEDFIALVDEAHAMGFTVLMDWVANHTGWDCSWISEHPDWYTQNSKGEVISPEGMGWPDVADLNYDNEEMRAEMIDCMKYWIDNADIDGFRCDYATGVPVDFWESARPVLEEAKRARLEKDLEEGLPCLEDAGEILEDSSRSALYMLAEDNLVPSLLDSAFDSNYNWNLYDSIIQVGHDSKTADKLKYYLQPKMQEGTFAMNFTDNHDKNSYEYTLETGYGFDGAAAMYALTFTSEGVPLVYSGDEEGGMKALSFMEKDLIEWESDHSYRELLTELAKIRTENEALYAGSYGAVMEFDDSDNRNVLIFHRTLGDNSIKCILNLSKREQETDISSVIDASDTCLLHYVGEKKADDSFDSLEDNLMDPWEFVIIQD
ncbi:alpha-amylase family glycosyl hydrolase [Butyrivibrio sp. MC2013]|uniref:alpha-amylase family glycosyl hydrolase n=1 Tax=Butyrivibrio sp. MC2013 TaxID=1280686 RepID=UPI0018C9D5DB|nr:alpha-amylase family glycosyl hydrolase [Butyrivibrio sp. MC2013]